MPVDVSSELSRAIYTAMLAKHWTQADLEQKADVSATVLTEILWRQGATVDPAVLRQIGDALGLDRSTIDGA